ncbi:MAG TPA: hypothetical protein VJY62_02510 [Bacteroidia bacterium]|nr:hypothetical protein [Bacteroidia bacterium]
MNRAGKIIYIGIDPGIETGFAVWNKQQKQFWSIKTLKIHQAFAQIHELYRDILKKEQIFVRVEDARKRKWFGGNADQKKFGAGAIKIQCTIWEEFLTDMKIDFEMVAPIKNGTKWKDDYFKRVTGWPHQTSNHSRDAAALVFQM